MKASSRFNEAGNSERLRLHSGWIATARGLAATGGRSDGLTDRAMALALARAGSGSRRSSLTLRIRRILTIKYRGIAHGWAAGLRDTAVDGAMRCTWDWYERRKGLTGPLRAGLYGLASGLGHARNAQLSKTSTLSNREGGC